MCDTIVAPPSHTAGQAMLFGKNSDRQRNEAQTVEYFPGGEHASDAQLTCTYLTIPQARRTYSVVVCRPFWAWGVEMGANEHGVVIGNEAVHARSPASERGELPGMDLVRLGLERAVTASDAIDVMTALLSRHGAGGNCGHLIPAYFNNGFIIADATDAFVLETVDREWVVERVDVPRSISNTYSIGKEIDRCSAGLSTLVRERGWSDVDQPHYAQAMANPNREHIGFAKARRARSTSLLQAVAPLGVEHMIRTLRDHGPAPSTGEGWHPDQRGPFTLCMHASEKDRYAQTTGSMVCELQRNHAVHWVTGTAAPCMSIFKPVVLGVAIPAHGPLPTDTFDAQTLWWRHERLHRAVLLGDLNGFLDEIHNERDALEAKFRARMNAVMHGGSHAEQSRVIDQCWKEAQELEDRWYSRLAKPTRVSSPEFIAAWQEMNEIARMDHAEA
jgi:secernin